MTIVGYGWFADDVKTEPEPEPAGKRRRSPARRALVVMVSLFGLLDACTPAAHAAYAPSHIVNADSHLCLAVGAAWPEPGSTPVVQRPCDATDPLQDWEDRAGVPDLQRGGPQELWLDRGTWCLGGDVSSPARPAVFAGSSAGGGCLRFTLTGDSARGVMLREASTGLCLSTRAGPGAAGAGLTFRTCANGRPSTGQVWTYPRPVPGLYGGMYIRTTSDTGGFCSIGFNVFDQYGNGYILTAGHCAAVDTGAGWLADPSLGLMVPVAYSGAYAWRATDGTARNPGGDWGLLRYANAGYTPEHAVSLGNGAFRTVTGYSPPSNAEEVMFSGATSGATPPDPPHHILDVDAEITSCSEPSDTDCHHYIGLIKTDICTGPGDSGGALFDPQTGAAIGIGVGFQMLPLCHSYFMPVVEIVRQLRAQGITIHF